MRIYFAGSFELLAQARALFKDLDIVIVNDSKAWNKAVRELCVRLGEKWKLLLEEGT